MLADRFVGTFGTKKQMANIYDIDTTITEEEVIKQEQGFGGGKKNKFGQDALADDQDDFEFAGKKKQNNAGLGGGFGVDDNGEE